MKRQQGLYFGRIGGPAAIDSAMNLRRPQNMAPPLLRRLRETSNSIN